MSNGKVVYRKRETKCLVLLSGGLDSATAAYWAKANGYAVESIYFDYEHITRDREITCVGQIAEDLDIPLHILKVPLTQQFFLDARPLIAPGQQQEETTDKARIDVLICLLHWLTLASSFCICLSINEIVLGVTDSDRGRAPTLHAKFFTYFGKSVSSWASRPILVRTPFLEKNKADVVFMGHTLGVPLASTWSCNEQSTVHCGRCYDCDMRRTAFYHAGINDVTIYG